MSIDKAQKVSRREAIGLNWRIYKIWRSKYPRQFIAMGLQAVVEGLSPYANIFLVAQIINELAGNRDLDRLMFLTIALISSTAALSMLAAIFTRWTACHTFSSWHRVRAVSMEKILTMDFANIEKPRTKELLAKLDQLQNWGSWGIYKPIMEFRDFLRSLMSVLGAVTLTVTLFTAPVPEGAGWLTALNHPLFVFVLIILILCITFISPALSNKSNQYWTRESDMSRMGNRWFYFLWRKMCDEPGRQLDVRIYEQDKVVDKYHKLCNFGGPLDYFTGVLAKYAKGPMGALNAASVAVSHVLTAIIYIFVCLKAWGGAFAVGNITQYIRAITSLSQGISDLVGFVGMLRNNGVFLKDVFELLDMPDDMYMGSLTTEKRSDNKHEIEFRNVSFKYPGNDGEQWALRNVNIKFAVGQRLAIVGENGSGKTTFIKLLCRLYHPTEGEILLNGIDIRKYDYAQYMDIFSVVFQDFQLLAQSLASNVAASLNYDESKARDSLIKSGFEQRLSEMSLNTYLYKNFDSEGIDVSSGEAQKIALARALYKDAPFVILDEPTAALDPITEFEIYSKMNEIVGNKTAIFISHRLSSCRFCSNIAVFDRGGIVQHGSHDELVAKKDGKYFKLWNAQAQYYTEETA